MRDFEALVSQLESFVAVLPPAARCAGDEGAKWKPDEAHWSIVEIVNHLADEEVEDFRTRVFSTLSDPSVPWPGIDPEGAAVERDYQHKDLEESIARFCDTRRESVAMLRALDAPDWSLEHSQPPIGVLRAGDVLASWVAHDALHLRQISKRLFELSKLRSEPFAADYAGRWSDA